MSRTTAIVLTCDACGEHEVMLNPPDVVAWTAQQAERTRELCIDCWDAYDIQPVAQ